MPRSTSPSFPIGMLMLAATLAGTLACGSNKLQSGHVLDEAMRANRTPASMPAADEDYFHDMDGGLALTREEVQGRNMWIVWTGGNDRFWDAHLRHQLRHARLPEDAVVASVDARTTAATIASDYLGLVNEPCFKKATGPDPNRYGLWLDVRDPACAPDPFANDDEVSRASQIGARGKTVPVGSYYGEPTGIVGLRLFPNPGSSTRTRRKKWDSERYYRDPDYYFSKDLVKPYRVGMSCALLSRRPESGQAAGRSRESAVGEPELERRRAVFLGRSHLQLAGRREQAELLLPAVPHVAARRARHVARLDRQHQQPADDERGLLPRAADGRRPGSGARKRSPAAA